MRQLGMYCKWVDIFISHLKWTYKELKGLDELMLSEATRSSMLWIAYLQKRGDAILCSKLWWRCLLAITSADCNSGKELLTAFLDASEQGLLPTYLKPMDDELDQYVAQLVADAVSSNVGDSLTLANRLLCKPGEEYDTS